MTDVGDPTKEYGQQSKKWNLPRSLMGGTIAMRAKREDYLPREEGESVKAYDGRVTRSVLFNAFRKTVKDMTGKVFEREVVLGDDVPDQIKEWSENVDLTGRHLNVFARDLFDDAMQVGLCHILVDMPPAIEGGTLADEQTAGIRPYLCHVKAEDLIGWKSKFINGVETLTQIRVREKVLDTSDNPFEDNEIEQIRVIYAKGYDDETTSARWEIWRQGSDTEKGKWVLFQSGVLSLDEIPLVTVYLNRTGFMRADPPLEDLADLNVAHWQSQSDQRNILHVARVPILFGAGFTETAKVVLGAGTMVTNSDPNAKLEYVEHSGAAIDSGDKDLENLQFQMQTQGLQLLIPKPGGQTATGAVLDNSKENSPLAMMATALGDALEQAIGYMGEFGGLGEEDSDVAGSVQVNTDFSMSAGAQDLQQLIAAASANLISRETFWTEMQRRDFLSESFDPDVEASRIGNAAPDLGAGIPPGKGMKLNGAKPANNGAKPAGGAVSE